MLRKISLGLFGIGFLIFLSGFFQMLTNRSYSSQEVRIGVTSSTERSAAIKAARAVGKKEYSYVTHFTPGIGVISDPNAFLENWQKDAEKSQQ